MPLSGGTFSGRKETELQVVELEVKISAGDLYDYMLRHTYSSLSGMLGSLVGALLVIAALPQKRWFLLIAGIFLLAYLPWTLFVHSRRQCPGRIW